jgi:hypothetical protein
VHVFGEEVRGQSVVLSTGDAVDTAAWEAGRCCRSADVTDALMVLDQEAIVADVDVVLRPAAGGAFGLAAALDGGLLAQWLPLTPVSCAVQRQVDPVWLAAPRAGPRVS